MIILIIFKNISILNNVSTILTQEQHTIIAASNSIEAISVLSSRHIDLVLTEVDIGGLDGWRLARLIRSGVLVSDIDLPIILITENHCERIAETTARMFDINRVTSYQELNDIANVVEQTKLGIGNLNKHARILVIEDTVDTANLVQRMLQHKYQIDLAYNGIDGIEAFKTNDYDIVLLDIMMPGMSGDEVLDTLMQLNPKQVVIAMTAHGNIDLAELMLSKGASDYIQKPFKADQLRKICDIAASREDFIVSNQQFSEKALALKNEQAKFESLSKTHYRVLDSLNSIVIEIDPTGTISFINNAWYKLTGFMVSDSLGKHFTDFIYDNNNHVKRYIENIYRQLLINKQPQDNIEIKLKTKTKQYFWCEVNLSPYFNEANELVGVSGTIDDITVRKKAEQKLQHVAFHDTLTGLHNRYYFDELLTNTSVTAQRTGKKHSLLYIDLDHFKIINDSQGHHQGDLVLKEISYLLNERTRKTDVLCRIGGDEFAMMLHNTSVDDAYTLALDICQSVSDACFGFGDKVYKVSCSIGITEVSGKALSSDMYLQQADIAMFVAKDRGRNRVHLYTEDDKLSDEVKQSFQWAQKLQKALIEDNIVLHFQPIINLKTKKIDCYEALVRLIVDDKIVFPDRFIPYIEKAGDMNLLDRHVIGKAFSMMHTYPELEKLAINLSAQAFADDRLVLFVEEKLKQYEINASRVIFELTETASLSNITGTQRLVTRLNELGCGFSIDDFGTGFSTFSYLKQIPAESVKIDGSFVKDMMKDATDAALVKAIHDTAQALNKKTVAEFVENEATLVKLTELGVHYAQGYHIAKPMPIEALLAYKNSLNTTV